MKTMDRTELEQLRARVLRDDHCQDDVFALIDELIEARRVGMSMCSLAHNLQELKERRAAVDLSTRDTP